jgi:lipopolysaccharide/colanic/teichoic acid biosynthesis glycosyltransferase
MTSAAREATASTRLRDEAPSQGTTHRARHYAPAKRGLDLAGALLLLLLGFPILVLAAVAIRLDSRGPVLFSQLRCGRDARRFRLYKLRTMTQDAEARQDAIRHLNEMDGPAFKIRLDPRVTRVGQVLRRWSLDELPQLWNVVLGDMSLVGPRPPLPREVVQYTLRERARFAVPPGLTGLWQVSGRNELPFADWMRLDLHYVENATLSLDFQILAETVGAVLRGRGAS